MKLTAKITSIALIALLQTAPALAVNLGNVETDVTIGDTTQTSNALLGESENLLELGVVKGGTNLGQVKTHVTVKNVTQNSKALLGKSTNKIRAGNVK